MSAGMAETIKEALDRPGWPRALGHRVYDGYYLLREWAVPARRRARRLDHAFDARYGVRTKAFIAREDLGAEGENVRHATSYHAVRPTEFETLMRYAPADLRAYWFIDFGSGMGRALVLASELPFRRIVGVEFSPELHRIAGENVRRYRTPTQQCREFDLRCEDAVAYEIPAAPAVYYFYNPFKRDVMRTVLGRIARSLAASPRDALFFYHDPVCLDVFREFPFETVAATRHYAVFRVGAP